ncbi:hypothetical protein AAFF_G00215380 [Aldrovandia affinis]|uniref:Uncharacterized protein n=1 Tax=Aldrovandia affinis TaxID=143900 RepID=A0AAD7W498_9TELE|nr:hypothetical protein AAFF_G00215380 [Aldrovandia affinis]
MFTVVKFCRPEALSYIPYLRWRRRNQGVTATAGLLSVCEDGLSVLSRQLLHPITKSAQDAAQSPLACRRTDRSACVLGPTRVLMPLHMPASVAPMRSQ